MDFVKIKGKDIQDCFMQMKMKYGPEAHVYNQRIIMDGGLLGTKLMAKKMYEIEVGIPEQQTAKDRVEKKLQDLKDLLRQKSEDDGKKKSNLEDLRPILERKEKPVMTTNSEVKTEKELGLSIKDELVKRDNSSRQVLSSYESVYLKRLRDRLVSEGMSFEFADDLMMKADKHLSMIDKEKPSIVNDKVAELLEDRISVDSDLFSGTGRGKRKVIFFEGPTGSGKTTTIAKLAAKYFLHMGRMVSIYSTDNYKIAGIEQLKRYAETMDIPFNPIKDVRKLQEYLHRDGAELILIDTPGYSHKNADMLNKQKVFKDVFGEKDQIETILVLPATSSASNMKSVLSAYEAVGYKRIILTKLDETDCITPIVELADIFSKSFVYLSTGQEVPFDVTAASKKLISEIVISPDKIKETKGEVVAAFG